MDGNKLLKDCEPDEVNFSDGMCYGYIAGVYDQGRYTPRACIPNGVTLKQLIDVTKQYLRDTPAKRHQGADVLIVQAFRDAWPCPE